MGNYWQRAFANDERARDTDEVKRLCERYNTLKGKPWTWQWGETNPRSLVRKAVEHVKNVRTEFQSRWKVAEQLRQVMSRRGQANPQEGRFSASSARATENRRRYGRTLERRYAHERMNLSRKRQGTAPREKPQRRRKRRAQTGAGEPMTLLAWCIQYSEGQRTS